MYRLTPEMIEATHRRIRELDGDRVEPPPLPLLKPLPIWNPILIMVLVAGLVVVTILNVILPRLFPAP